MSLTRARKICMLKKARLTLSALRMSNIMRKDSSRCLQLIHQMKMEEEKDEVRERRVQSS